MNAIKKILMLAPLATLMGCSTTPRRPAAADASPLQRQYKLGEVLKYHITMVHSVDGMITSTYDAYANGTVKQDANGTFYEEFRWTDLKDDGKLVSLSPAGRDLKQMLSLSPDFKMTIPPELPILDKSLIGPVTDLLTFYADDSVSIRQPRIRNAGDHTYLKTSIASSWGAGQDCIDFDVTLSAIDTDQRVATLEVDHVPPAAICITPPVDWMKTQVTDVPNNWYEVESAANKWTGSAGKETFAVVMKIDLSTGVIRSATMNNPVVLESRECNDQRLTDCSQPTKHNLVRKLTFTLVP